MNHQSLATSGASSARRCRDDRLPNGAKPFEQLTCRLTLPDTQRHCPRSNRLPRCTDILVALKMLSAMIGDLIILPALLAVYSLPAPGETAEQSTHP